ncbi:hypothetical protein PtB15_18B316 [Puccinia triticina]|nr:hypothetical protein PtB15_18B316 [Puccinia triticina]
MDLVPTSDTDLMGRASPVQTPHSRAGSPGPTWLGGVAQVQLARSRIQIRATTHRTLPSPPPHPLGSLRQPQPYLLFAPMISTPNQTRRRSGTPSNDRGPNPLPSLRQLDLLPRCLKLTPPGQGVMWSMQVGANLKKRMAWGLYVN